MKLVAFIVYKMKKIIVKLPDERVKKFRLQKRGWASKRYLTATRLVNRLEDGFCLKELEEKTAIVVKEQGSRGFEIINETLASKDTKYLLSCLTCFLEEFLSRETLYGKLKR